MDHAIVVEVYAFTAAEPAGRRAHMIYVDDSGNTKPRCHLGELVAIDGVIVSEPVAVVAIPDRVEIK